MGSLLGYRLPVKGWKARPERLCLLPQPCPMSCPGVGGQPGKPESRVSVATNTEGGCPPPLDPLLKGSSNPSSNISTLPVGGDRCGGKAWQGQKFGWCGVVWRPWGGMSGYRRPVKERRPYPNGCFSSPNSAQRSARGLVANLATRRHELH